MLGHVWTPAYYSDGQVEASVGAPASHIQRHVCTVSVPRSQHASRDHDGSSPYSWSPNRRPPEPGKGQTRVIFIVVKFPVRPDQSDEWLSIVENFTTATRAEPGNVFFEWSRSVDNPNHFVLVEAFRDREAGEAHVNSDHFKAAMARMPDAISETPEIVNVEIPGDGWASMAELQPRGAK